MVDGPEEKLQYHKTKLEMMWGPPVPAARIAEIRYKTLDDLSSWEKSCRSRAAYALGRASGDGFWEAKVEWYGTRANFIKKVIEEKGSGATKNSPPGSRSFPPAPMKKRWIPTPGGWPDAIQVKTPPSGLTLSGPPTEKSGMQSMHGTEHQHPDPDQRISGCHDQVEEPNFLINEDN